ncbi:MAG: fused MFS/spermidine synthase [Acidobacteriota bacterium]|nr:fused MFS/spermidine synthase [Acidobacteriota bacterium]
MTPVPLRMTSAGARTRVVGLSALFLLSGFSALVYQVAWLRLLTLVFGVTVYAASAVLSSFMGGLALGSWLGGRLADRTGRPLRAFGLVELAIGASAVAVPGLLILAEPIYASLHATALDGLPFLTAARLACAALVLIIPTTLMGASLPLLARHVASLGGGAAGRIGLLYAANTTGAVAGTLLAGYVLIAALGITATTHLAVAVNAIVGLTALGLGRASREIPDETGERVPAVPAASRGAVPAVMATAGFLGLALEVVWFRLLLMFLPATTYAFTAMLSTVLLGIALGSAVASLRVRRSADPVRALARLQIATGLAVVVSMATLSTTYAMGWRTGALVQASVLAILPSATLMGAAFPFALAAWLREGKDAGRGVGLLYAVNVSGAVVGALAGGFIVLPLLGAQTGLVTLAGAYVVAGVCLTAVHDGRSRGLRAAVAGSVMFGIAALLLPDVHASVIARKHGAGERVLFRHEGAQTTTAVHQRFDGARVLYLDGLHQANDTDDMVRLHSAIGHLPMALHPAPARTLVVGLGGGVTAGAVAAYGVPTEIVELAGGVIAAAPFFEHVNGRVLTQPHVRLRVDDGRNHLTFTGERYDVVTADIIQPFHAGAGNLYSLEYFRLARGVLRDGGVMLQWIGHRETTHYKLIMRTFLEAFPDATLWAGGTLLAGGTGRLSLSREVYARKLANPVAAAALASAGLDSFDALLGWYTADAADMRRFVGEGPILTDDRPLLEFHRSIRPSPPIDVATFRGDVRRHIVEGPRGAAPPTR